MNQLSRLKEYIHTSRNLVVFTGAGISTESGISDYRSKGGLWDRYSPVTIQEFLSDRQKRAEYWKRKLEIYEAFIKAQPNSGHKALVTLEKSGKLKSLITQNIDGLHQMAGNSPDRIIELHGNNRETVCLNCQEVTPWKNVFERVKGGDYSPLCIKCQGLLKPNTISFGQQLNPLILDQAVRFSCECDLMLVVGSTLVVEPAASLPRMAKRFGATLVIITLSDTPLDQIADLKIEGAASEVLTAAVEAI